MYSSSLANWDGSQTARKQEEIARKNQDLGGSVTTTIAFAIAGPSAIQTAAGTFGNAGHREEDSANTTGDANKARVVDFSTDSQVFRRQDGTPHEGFNIDRRTPTRDIISIFKPGTSEVDVRSTPTVKKSVSTPVKTYLNGCKRPNNHEGPVATSSTFRTHAPTTSQSVDLTQTSRYGSRQSQLEENVNISTPKTLSRPTLLSLPIFASPENCPRIPSPSRHESPASAPASHYGSLFTPAPSPTPLPAQAPMRKKRLRPYIAVPPFPPGLTKYHYSLLPRKRGDRPYHQADGLEWFSGPSKKRARNREEDHFGVSGAREKPNVHSSPKSSSPKKKQVRSNGMGERIETRLRVNDSWQKLMKDQERADLAYKTKAKSPSRKDRLIPITTTITTTAVYNMQLSFSAHSRFLKQDIEVQIASRREPLQSDLPLQAYDCSREHCWKAWSLDENAAGFPCDSLTAGFLPDEVEVDDLVVLSSDEGQDKHIPPNPSRPKLVTVPMSLSTSTIRKHQPNSPEPSPRHRPLSPNKTHTSPTHEPLLHHINGASQTMLKAPSAKALGKQKAVEPPDEPVIQWPPFTITSQQQSPSGTLPESQESPRERGARQYFLNVFDSPIRLSTHDSAFKHAASSDIVLGSTYDHITEVPTGHSLESSPFSPTAGLSQSHSTTLTSSYDDMLSAPGIDTLSQHNWNRTMSTDQIPFGDGTINPSLLGGSYLPIDDFAELQPMNKSPSPMTPQFSPPFFSERTPATPPLFPARSPSPAQQSSSQFSADESEDELQQLDPPLSPTTSPHHTPSRLPPVVTQHPPLGSDNENDIPISLLIEQKEDDEESELHIPPPEKRPTKRPPKKAQPLRERCYKEDWPRQNKQDCCHQCRSTSNILKLFCSCAKRYCVRCLTRWYDEDAGTLPRSGEEFTCPFCRDICTCDICTVRRGETYQSKRVRRGSGRPPGIRPEDLPALPRSSRRHPAQKIKSNAQPVVDTPITPFEITGPIHYFGAMYDLNGNKVGTTFSGGNTDYVVFQPLGGPRPRKSSRIFIGEVQPCWQLGDGYLLHELNPLHPEDCNNGPNERFYIGDRRMLYKPSKPRYTEPPLQEYYFDAMDSPLTDLEEAEEFQQDLGGHGEGEFRQPFDLDMQNPDSGIASQEDHEQFGKDDQQMAFPPLREQGLVRAIALGLTACGLNVRIRL